MAFWIVWSFQCSISHNLQKTSSSCDDPSRRALAKKMPSIKKMQLYIKNTVLWLWRRLHRKKKRRFQKDTLREGDALYWKDVVSWNRSPWNWKRFLDYERYIMGLFRNFKGHFGTILCHARTKILKGNMFQHVPYAFEVWMEVFLKLVSAAWIRAFVRNPGR